MRAHRSRHLGLNGAFTPGQEHFAGQGFGGCRFAGRAEQRRERRRAARMLGLWMKRRLVELDPGGKRVCSRNLRDAWCARAAGRECEHQASDDVAQPGRAMRAAG